MKKLKIMTIVGTRPEIIRLSRVISCLEKNFDHTLVHTGQNYDHELNQIFFDDLEINVPNIFLNAVGNTPSKTIGKIISLIDDVLINVKPDAVLVLGDTNSCLSVICAKKYKIPIFHMEAGNRCFDLRVPEEINRKIVDHISDINLTYSDIARQYLIQEGFPIDRIIKTGSPMYEVINYYKEKINNSKILKKLKLKKENYFVVSCHREENVEGKNLKALLLTLNKLCEIYKYPIIFSTHPRTRIKIDSLGLKFSNLIQFLKPLNFTDYNKLQLESFIVLSDSGTISEESSILNFRALNIREAHERPEAMEEAAVIMTGCDKEAIIQGINIIKNQKVGNERTIDLVKDYDVNNVSEKISRIILSYTEFVNKKNWFKI